MGFNLPPLTHFERRPSRYFCFLMLPTVPAAPEECILMREPLSFSEGAHCLKEPIVGCKSGELIVGFTKTS